VSLRVTSGEQIRAAPMQLRFDPAVLESVSFGPDATSAPKDGKLRLPRQLGRLDFRRRLEPDSASASDAEMLVLTFKSIKAVAAAEISVASLNLQGAAAARSPTTVSPFRTTITLNVSIATH